MLAAHADWSVDARKRWITCAEGEPGAGGGPGEWRVGAAEPVGDVATLLDRLRDRTRDGIVALGIDCPLGLPHAYARRHATTPDFPSFLRALADHPSFFSVCDEIGQVRADRPFFPRRGLRGMSKAAHAVALGLGDTAAMNRRCDLKTAERPAGGSLFWTVGANQVGKAAISAWRDMLIPALRTSAPPRLWPFDGPYRQLLGPGRVAIAETYPAEAARHVGVRLTGSKRTREARRAAASNLNRALTRAGARSNKELRTDIEDGFGRAASGEDRFDTLLGLLCLLNVVNGTRTDDIPDDANLRIWEGWVLGQSAFPSSQMQQFHGMVVDDPPAF